jgi:hypothetical protein
LATPAEIQKQKQQQQAQKSKAIAAVSGTVAQLAVEGSLRIAERSGVSAAERVASSYRGGTILATIIDLASGIGIAAYSFLSQKKRAKKKEKQTKNQAAIQSYVDLVLDEISTAGETLVNNGINPLTPEFEQQLYNTLFNKVGYRGHCNATVWTQGSGPGPNRPIMFKATKDGRVVIPVTMKDPPDDLQTYWYSHCRGLKDNWVLIYQDQLIQQGRAAELEELQSTLRKGQWIVHGVFATIFLFAIVFWVMNMRRIR